ncbi:MAG: hypothetical protein DRQ88_05880 [Epsilonproteobacteria bacterium]|nr:MAG: hypothetical protein DRQ88_05880 [Campylobacterota bacterium]
MEQIAKFILKSLVRDMGTNLASSFFSSVDKKEKFKAQFSQLSGILGNYDEVIKSNVIKIEQILATSTLGFCDWENWNNLTPDARLFLETKCNPVLQGAVIFDMKVFNTYANKAPDAFIYSVETKWSNILRLFASRLNPDYYLDYSESRKITNSQYVKDIWHGRKEGKNTIHSRRTRNAKSSKHRK